MRDTASGAKSWLRQQTKLGQRAVRGVVGIGLATALAGIGQAICLGFALEAAVAGATALPLLAAFAALGVFKAGLTLLFERRSFEAGASARRRLRTELLAGVLASGPAVLRGRHSGELASAAIDRIEALDGLFARFLPAKTLAVAGPLLVLLALLWLDPWAAAIVGATGLLVPVGMAFAGIGAASASRKQFAAMARLQTRFLDRVRGIATIVLYGRAEDEARALAAAAEELRARTMRVLRVAFLSSTVLELAAAAALVALALRAVGERLAPGVALAELLLVPEFFAPLRLFAGAYQDGMAAHGAAEALVEYPAAPPPEIARPVRHVAARGVAVAFEDVHFTWDPARGKALDGLSFRAPAGETLVLVGPSGAGKTTILDILLGFVRPDAGRVTINGADIATLVPQALSNLTAWMGQRPMLFAGSIRDNIRFARPEATEAEIDEAAKFGQVDAFAARLPQGLDTVVGEGGYGLSGGQAQRVALARAFLKNAPLLLLDEPTAHLDPVTEAEVLDGLRRLAAGRTVILASHSAAAHSFGGRRLDLRAGRAATMRGVA
jgi:ATP-binding cassette subfamily C protein CydD